MMLTIWKFELPFADRFSVEMPQGARLLHVGTQTVEKGSIAVAKVFLWAAVHTDALRVKRVFRMIGTGHESGNSDIKHAPYVGTFFLSGPLVLHLFDLGEEGRQPDVTT